jgi:hypothetical protein
MRKTINPSGYKPPTTFRLTLAIILLAILMVVMLTGLTRNSPTTLAAEEQPTLIATTTPVRKLPWTAQIFPEPADPINQTNGIIIAGGVIVLIILGGTIGATRHKH